MKEIIWDIEANGLDDATRIHCLSYCVMDEFEVKTIYDYEEMREFFKQNATFIGHYITNYDLPLLHRLLGIDFTDVHFIDTIFFSNYIFPGRLKYSLESFGEDYGVPKVKVGNSEWDGDMSDPAFKTLMTDRCAGDVKINTNLWVDINKRLDVLYKGEPEAREKLEKYLIFKGRRAYEQQLNPLLIDVKAAEDLLLELYTIKQEKESELIKVMPRVPIYITKEKPKVMYKKDGSISTIGQKWLDFLEENNLPADTNKPVRFVKGFEEPNPQSNPQLKGWLYSLGWVPDVFRFERNKISNERKSIPQILNENKELSLSVKALLDKEPNLILLEGLGLVSHRIALVNGILEKAYKNGGWVTQTLKALGSTHRFKHQTIVNLPSVMKPFGKEIRSLFTAPEGMVVCGVDVKNLESRTRDHSIQPIDPSYVEELSDPNFCSHLDIAVVSGMLTAQQAQDHKDGVADYSKERKIAKQINFASVYNVGSKTLSINTGFPIEKCEQLLQSYWERNWAVKEYASRLKVKNCLGGKWLKSELSGFWLELRSDNDKFSAHNQNAGVLFFDTWCAYLALYGIVVRLQMHDEILLYVNPLELERTKQILNKCCAMANKKLNLNVVINVDIQVGINYSETH
jgi:hypothetical protein